MRFNAVQVLAFQANAGTDPVPDRCLFFALRTPWRKSKLQKKPSAFKWEHPAAALQSMIFFHFLISVFCFAFLDSDPDPADQNHCRSIRIQITKLVTKQEKICSNPLDWFLIRKIISQQAICNLQRYFTKRKENQHDFFSWHVLISHTIVTEN